MLKIEKAIKLILTGYKFEKDKLYQIDNKITTGGLKMAENNNLDWRVSTVKNFVKNQSVKSLITFFGALIQYGISFKGINKTDQEVKLIIELFVNECIERFQYLTIFQIEKSIKSQNFGDVGITVANLIECVEKSYSFETQKNNRLLEEQLQRERQKQLESPKEKPLDRKEKVDFLRKAFSFWKLRGYVADLTGEIWEYANEIAPNYKPTFSDKKRYLSVAKMSCCEYFFNKNKLKYGLVIRVAKDKKLLKSKEFKTALCSEYKELYLRDFFKRSKWNINQ